jgi:hypothetical protein
MNSPAELPRIAKVKADLPSSLVISWRGGGKSQVDLAGWIAIGGEILAPLRDPALFATARVDEYGADVQWGDDDDLLIDGRHLRMLADEQRPFGPADIEAWQRAANLSNQEAADFLGIALSTFHAYRKGSSIPTAVQIACRAALRDPMVMQAHFKPRYAGRRFRPTTSARPVAVKAS